MAALRLTAIVPNPWLALLLALLHSAAAGLWVATVLVRSDRCVTAVAMFAAVKWAVAVSITRECLRAGIDIDAWARNEGTPFNQEITGIRRLINTITTELDDLAYDDRADVEQAVASVLRHSLDPLAP